MKKFTISLIVIVVLLLCILNCRCKHMNKPKKGQVVVAGTNEAGATVAVPVAVNAVADIAPQVIPANVVPTPTTAAASS